MKKKALIVVLLILGILLVCSYFYVDGTELPSIGQLTGEYSCKVVKNTYVADMDHTVEYTLSSAQIPALQELLQNSRFSRTFSPMFTYKGQRESYTITFELRDDQNKQLDFIDIFFVEDGHLTISAPYAHKSMTLIIRNDQLDEQLDAILAGALPN